MAIGVLPDGVVRGRKNPAFFGFAARLRNARHAMGLTLDSTAVHVSDGKTVFLLEAGRHVPRLDTVEKIALALCLTPGFLAFGLSTESHETPAATEGLRALGVAARVQEARIAQGLSVLALAKAAGLSHTAVGNVERGTMPSLETAERLAVALAVSPAWLAFGEGPRALPPRRRTTRAAASASP